MSAIHLMDPLNPSFEQFITNIINYYANNNICKKKKKKIKVCFKAGTSDNCNVIREVRVIRLAGRVCGIRSRWKGKSIEWFTFIASRNVKLPDQTPDER